jgi:membrane associated rhomboid family serine protease
MSAPPNETFTFLMGVDRPSMVPLLEETLRRAGIPYQSGLLSLPTPKVIFSVPRSRLDDARRAIADKVPLEALSTVPAGSSSDEPAPDASEEDVEPASATDSAETTFPSGPVLAVLFLVVVHVCIVLAFLRPGPSIDRLVAIGGLVTGRTFAEPWRLLTSLFVHADPSHALWNGLSLLVFAVPLLLRLGPLRTWSLYLLAGVCGQLLALASTTAGTVTIGSSGAVAGLFGLWITQTLRRTRHEGLTRRARIRIVGLALLVLPSLLTPTTQGGQEISVAAHLGGLAAGLLFGLLVRERQRPRRAESRLSERSGPRRNPRSPS